MPSVTHTPVSEINPKVCFSDPFPKLCHFEKLLNVNGNHTLLRVMQIIITACPLVVHLMIRALV